MIPKHFLCFFLALSTCLWLTPNAAAKHVVAVSTFANHTGNADLDFYGKGLQGMLTTDLLGIQSLEIVERERVRDLLKEIELGKSGYVDPATAQKLGKGLGAAYVLTGSYVLGGGTLRLDARLVEVESSKVVMAEKASGPKDDIFALANKVIVKLTNTLKLKLSRVEQRKLKKQREASFEAFSLYSKSLNAFDRGKVTEARKLLEQALKINEDFDLALAELDEVEKHADAAINKNRFLPEQTVKLVDGIAAGRSSLCVSLVGALTQLSNEAGGAIIGGQGMTPEIAGKKIGQFYALVRYIESQTFGPDTCTMMGRSMDFKRAAMSMFLVFQLGTIVGALDNIDDMIAAEPRRKKDLQKMRERIPEILDGNGKVLVSHAQVHALYVKLAGQHIKRHPDDPMAQNIAPLLKKAVNRERMKRMSPEQRAKAQADQNAAKWARETKDHYEGSLFGSMDWIMCSEGRYYSKSQNAQSWRLFFGKFNKYTTESHKGLKAIEISIDGGKRFQSWPSSKTHPKSEAKPWGPSDFADRALVLNKNGIQVSYEKYGSQLFGSGEWFVSFNMFKKPQQIHVRLTYTDNTKSAVREHKCKPRSR